MRLFDRLRDNQFRIELEMHRWAAHSAGRPVERIDCMLERLEEFRRYLYANCESLVNYNHARIAGEGLLNSHAYQYLTELSDDVGSRVTGSPADSSRMTSAWKGCSANLTRSPLRLSVPRATSASNCPNRKIGGAGEFDCIEIATGVKKCRDFSTPPRQVFL